MKKILILFSHPNFENSRSNNVLIEHVKNKEGITFHDLYEAYPDFYVDVPHEKELLSKHDIIIWQHPLYWYSCPPLMKQWIDLVLEYGWAHGPGGNALHGKTCLNVITTGGSKEIYCAEGKNSYTINEFLRPLEQTAKLCGMNYLPPYAIMGTQKLTAEELDTYGDQYAELISLLQQGLSFTDSAGCFFLNDIPNFQTQ